MLHWLKQQWARFQRADEANKRGWGSLGRMFAYGNGWSDSKWGREIRRSNRLYRLAHGRNPWKPYGKF